MGRSDWLFDRESFRLVVSAPLLQISAVPEQVPSDGPSPPWRVLWDSNRRVRTGLIRKPSEAAIVLTFNHVIDTLQISLPAESPTINQRQTIDQADDRF